MALEFTSDPPVTAAGLCIRFDMRGLQDLLAAMQGAMEEGTFTIGGGNSPGAFGSVTFTFNERRDDRPAEKTPAPPLVLETVD